MLQFWNLHHLTLKPLSLIALCEWDWRPVRDTARMYVPWSYTHTCSRIVQFGRGAWATDFFFPPHSTAHNNLCLLKKALSTRSPCLLSILKFTNKIISIRGKPPSPPPPAPPPQCRKPHLMCGAPRIAALLVSQGWGSMCVNAAVNAGCGTSVKVLWTSKLCLGTKSGQQGCIQKACPTLSGVALYNQSVHLLD